MMTSTAPAVALEGLTKEFRAKGETVRAVRGIDLRVERGEVVAVLGPNGAGKTTTLDMVLGLTTPTHGTAQVFGRAPRDAVVEGRVSAVLQTGGLLRDLTVRETVQMAASMFREHRPVPEVLEQAGIVAIADRRVASCSGGEQQRLRFALALLPDPDLIVLDEPTAGMDVTSRRAFWETMHADADAGRTVLFATHYLEEADAFADRSVLFAGGRIVADGPTEEIRARATGRTVSAYLDPNGPSFADVEARLRGIPTVHAVTRQGHRVSVLSGASDAVALTLLTECGARNLEVATGSLESAFLTITAGPATSEPSDAVMEAAR